MNLLCCFLSARSRLRTRRTFADCGMLRVICWAYSTALLLIAIHGPPAVAEEPPAAIADEQVPAQRVVLRVSEGTLNELWGSRDVDRQTDVRDMILGTSVYGRARVVGTSRIELTPSADQATFRMIFEGTAYSRTTGYNGPAIIYSRAITGFTATKQIAFEPGEGFRAAPSQVLASTQVFVDGIDSTRGGLVGRVVRRRAAREESALHSQATEIARQRAGHRVAGALDRTTEQRLARLNWVAPLRELAATALSAADSGEPRFAFSTTPQYLQIATSFGDRGLPIEIPLRDTRIADGTAAEVWLHESLLGGRLPARLDLVTRPVAMRNVLSVLSATARAIAGNKDFHSPLGPFLAQQPVRIHKAGDWRVVALDMTSTAPRAIARASVPRAKPQSSSAVASVQRTRPLAAEPAPASRSVAAQSSDLPKNRIWTSGPYHADATFLALEGNMVRLLRTSGVRASIQFEKLSPADQQWITNYLAAE
jgi:SLA1 homology domain 1, SHD1